MNLKMLRSNGLIEYESIVGSHAYGTNISTSDIDTSGVFVYPNEVYLGLNEPIERIGDEKSDTVFYALRRFIQLLKTANPTLLEMLWMPDDCVKVCSPRIRKLIEHRSLFVSKKVYHSHSGYAWAQIKKAKGENKWINNKKSEEPPKREDFCWVVPMNGIETCKTQPCRPIQILEYRTQINPRFDLRENHVAALEHVPNTYRLYYYGDSSKGVFRDNNLVCESIPLEDEQKFWGLLIYNDQEYQKAMLDWKNYWTWVRERNPNRWTSQEKGEVDCDVKNMQHCMRLLMSGANILKTGEPIIRFDGADLQYLRDIREGHFTHEQLMADVDKRMADLELINKDSTLPWGADDKAIDDLYRELVI